MARHHKEKEFASLIHHLKGKRLQDWALQACKVRGYTGF